LNKNVLDYLDNCVLAHPQKTAVVCEDKQYTYQEVKDLADSIGSAILNFSQPKMPIPVYMEKSADTYALFLGIISAGCFYILIDPEQPASRASHILETLQAKVLIATKDTFKKAKELPFKGSIYLLEDLRSTDKNETRLAEIRNQSLDIDPLYGIFTSGSTGIPKGVVVSHRSVIDFIDCFTETFSIGADERIGNQAPFDFDVSVKDIYSALKVGASLVIIPKKYFSIPTKLLDYLEEHSVTTLIWAVSALCMVTTLKGFTYKIPATIKKVMFSGEVMPIKHLSLWQEAYPQADFVNLYGPTEITCNCTYYKIEKKFQAGEILPIGKAFKNERVFLLDEDNKEITNANSCGELCVSGTALALGYFGNWEQTNKAFVQNPLNPHYPEMIYRTGDLAYYNEDGLLCFKSRKDFQIKHMGHRIELGEIEAALDKIPEITRNSCIYLEEKNKILCFYQGTIDKKELVTKLKMSLLPYMVPNLLLQMEQLPITKNGKIDRNKLKEDYLCKKKSSAN